MDNTLSYHSLSLWITKIKLQNPAWKIWYKIWSSMIRFIQGEVLKWGNMCHGRFIQTWRRYIIFCVLPLIVHKLMETECIIKLKFKSLRWTLTSVKYFPYTNTVWMLPVPSLGEFLVNWAKKQFKSNLKFLKQLQKYICKCLCQATQQIHDSINSIYINRL